MAKEKTLGDGRIAVITDFKGKHVLQAQKESNGEEDTFLATLIAKTTTIDGKPIVKEDLEEMDGFDFLIIMGEFSAGFTRKPATS